MRKEQNPCKVSESSREKAEDCSSWKLDIVVFERAQGVLTKAKVMQFCIPVLGAEPTTV